MLVRKFVLDVISNERDAQLENLGAFVQEPTGELLPIPLFDWLNFIDEHLLRARRAATMIEASDEIRNLAACAVAAMEQYGARPRPTENDIKQPTLQALSDLMRVIPGPIGPNSATNGLTQRYTVGNTPRLSKKHKKVRDVADDEDDVHEDDEY